MLSLLMPVLLSASLQAGTPQAALGFERRVLDSEFRAEGASFGDFNRDGYGDIVSGALIYLGPDFTERIELSEPQVFDPHGYSDSFFNWTHDFDSDGWLDVLAVGFPGKEAAWFENPGAGGGFWQRHLVHDRVDNESPAFVDLVGDSRRELVCNGEGAFCYLTPTADPRAPWIQHTITPDVGKQRFTHGLGVGDIDGDGRADLIEKNGWWRQPEDAQAGALWQLHPFAFSQAIGGAQMLVYDIDGDGKNDVISSLHAHGWGLAWFEQVEGSGGAIDFVQHTLMGATPAESPVGLRFSTLHALALVDMDGDGLDDLVTGKRHWSHGPGGDPKPAGPSVLYWFRLERGDAGVRFVPHRIDGDSGVGTQVVAGDVNGDGYSDVLLGNKQGTFVFLQTRGAATPEAPPRSASRRGEPARDGTGRALNLGFDAGDLRDWTVLGQAFLRQPVLADATLERLGESSRCVGRGWVGGYEFDGDGPLGTLESVTFSLTADWASFLVGGGSSFDTRVELVAEDGEVLFRASGENYEPMKVALVDLRSHRGRRAFLRLVDGSSGGWGHINYDDFLFHDERPEIPDELLALTLDAVLHNGLGPRAATAAMTVPPGFEVDLIAAEPDLHQPIALAIDAAGRLWVAEAHSYPERRPKGQGLDRIVVFEDTRGDGEFDSRRVFAEGLNLVSGLEVGFGGVFVGAAPELLFLPDHDGDLVLDGEPQVLLDGWGIDDTHETLNAFTWGPDGWLYGCHGVFTHSLVGAAGCAADERVPINAGIWRYHPTRFEFEVFAWGTSNPWGIDFDEQGQAFITACVIPHLFHTVQGGRYLRQAGSHFGEHIYEDIQTIADHRHWLGTDPHGGNNKSSLAGGGHAHCGALLLFSDRFPAEYRGRIVMNNIHGNRVNTDTLERDGSGFVGRHGADLLLANDRCFRGISLKNGPDGALYFIDWSDAEACHLTDVEAWDRSNGRLYRLRYGALPPARASLEEADEDQLLALLDHDNSWHARTARRLLQERPTPGLADKLMALVRGDGSARLSLRALWAIHSTAGLDEAILIELLGSDDENLAAWSVQLAAEDGVLSASFSAACVSLARTTPSPRVRLYLASALERLGVEFEGAFDLARALLAREEDECDPNLSYLLWYGLSSLLEADPVRGLELARESRLSRPRRLAARQLAADPAGRELLSAEFATADDAWTEVLLGGFALALAERRGVQPPSTWAAAYERLALSEDESRRNRALWIAAAFQDPAAIPRLVAMAKDPAQPIAGRLRALDVLAASSAKGLAGVFLAALEQPQFCSLAISALARHGDERVPEALLALYPELEIAERLEVCATLSARLEYATALLTAIEDGRLPPAEVSAFVIRKLRAHSDENLDQRLAALFGIERETKPDKLARISELKSQLTRADPARTRPARGRLVFERTCAQCHALFGEGGDLAPDLTGSNRADLDYLLTNMVDPNAVIGRDYQVTVVRTFDGLLFTGVLKSETAEGLVLQSETEIQVVGQEEIEERYLSDISAMPEGQIETLAPGELRDLVAYLGSVGQVEIPELDAPSLDFFDGKTLAGWSGEAAVWRVESGEIVGQSEGLDHNSFLVSDFELGDFRFSCEVLLASNKGNSGIQFRSRALPGGSVAGYQADIGPGWWGKLYEEHGRGLLTSREAAVRTGDWNEYVIEAQGVRVRTWLNGELCLDLSDPEGARSGVFALQLHSGGATEVRFRNLRLAVPR
jgi:putative membrane-bound dehydrogenase-like protein